MKKYSQAAINRKRKFAQAAAPKELGLIDYLHKRKPRSNPPVNLKIGKSVSFVNEFKAKNGIPYHCVCVVWHLSVYHVIFCVKQAPSRYN